MKEDVCDLDIHDARVQTQKEKKTLPSLTQKSPNTHKVKL